MSTPLLDRSFLRRRLAALARKGVYIGTSSWKYEGWLGQVYTPERYHTRSRFSAAKFERECLSEYAEFFKTVCVDGAYYSFMSEKQLQDLGDQVPDDFRFAFKVTEEITVKRYPSLPRYGQRAGTVNAHFLNASLFNERFLGPLAVLREKAGPIIFEFSQFYPGEFSKSAPFLEALDLFFSSIPKGYLYCVELRNEGWLDPDYLSILSKHRVAHVYNSWTRMPPVSEQRRIVGELDTDELSVARFLLKKGRTYETAVESFKPYTRTHEQNDEARGAATALIDRQHFRITRKGTYIYINNRLEGNAINTILALLPLLKDQDIEVEIPDDPSKPAWIKINPAKPPPPEEHPQLDLGI